MKKAQKEFDRDELEQQLLIDYMEGDHPDAVKKPAPAESEEDEEVARALREYLGDESISKGEEQESSTPLHYARRYIFGLFVAAMAMVIVFIVYAWYTDKFAITPSSQGEVPLIQADRNPVRLAPEEKNGEVPDSDKRVYDAITPNAKKQLPKVERILPAPEEPMNRKALQHTESDSAVTEEPAESVSDLKERAPSDTENEIRDEALAEEKAAARDSDASALSELVEKVEKVEKAPSAKTQTVKEAPAKKETAKPAAPKPAVKDVRTDETVAAKASRKPRKEETAAAPKTTGGYRIQLGAFKSREEAMAEWSKLKSKYGSVLNGMEASAQRADLGNKGIYYRLQAGRFANEQGARVVCQKLIEHKQGCFFVKIP